MRVAIPSSHYHKSFSSKLIHNFIVVARETCKQSGIEVFEENQENYPKLLESDKKPFDILVSMGFTSLTPELAEFYKHHDIKVMLFQDDIHGKDDKDFRKKRRWIEFADILLVPYYKNFLSRKGYAECHSKAIEFPWFAPKECFKHDKKWSDRKDKILLSGCMAPVYSLRRNLRFLSQRISQLDVLEHPGYKPNRRKHAIIGNKYYSYLEEYKCAVATSADPPLDYPLSKYFEVPACGCVGIFEENETLADFGFKSGKHYVPITNGNHEHVVRRVIKNMDGLGEIASRCREYIKNNHTDVHRACQLVKILNDL